jgi:hypothetical protein
VLIMANVNLGEKFKLALEKITEVDSFKKDVLKLPRDIHITRNNSIGIEGLGEISFTKTGFQSFCTKLDIPSTFMIKKLTRTGKSTEKIEKDLKIFNDVLMNGVETLPEDKQMFLRTYQNPSGTGHKVRAVFSDSYNVVDNLPLLQQLEGFDMTQLETKNFAVNSDYMDLRFTMPHLKTSIGRLPQHEQRFGMTEDIVYPAIHFRNSETGLSKVQVSFVIYRLVCTNGLINQKDQFKVISKKHIGDYDIGEVTGRIARVVKDAEKMFEQYTNHMINAKAYKVDSPEDIFASIGKRAGITNRMMKVVNHNWLTDQQSERTKHGVINAITAGARDWETGFNDFSGRMKLEEVAGELLFAKAM